MSILQKAFRLSDITFYVYWTAVNSGNPHKYHVVIDRQVNRRILVFAGRKMLTCKPTTKHPIVIFIVHM